MNKLLIIFAGIFFFSGCNAQNEKQIDLQIINEEVRITDHKDKMKFNVTVTNNTDTTFLMYAFNMINEALTDEAFFTKGDNYTSGIAVFIENQDGERIIPKDFSISPPEDLDYKPTSLDTLENSLNRTGNAYVENMVILHPNSKIKEELLFKFKFHNLEQGTYNVYLLYYSGKNLYNLVSEERVKKDEIKYNAIEFRGWLKSNPVEFIIE